MEEKPKSKPKVRGHEHAARLNFLYQASEATANVCPTLARYYGQVMTVISEKTPVKRDFTMKRTMCKKCRVVLVLGVNATYRLRKKKGRKGHPTQVITCVNCKTVKRFPTNPNYQLEAKKNGIVESL